MIPNGDPKVATWNSQGMVSFGAVRQWALENAIVEVGAAERIKSEWSPIATSGERPTYSFVNIKPIVASRRADEMLERGDRDGQLVWLRIRRAIAELQTVSVGKPN